MDQAAATLSSPKPLGFTVYKFAGHFYTSEGMDLDTLDVAYACVCGVMGVGVIKKKMGM